MGGLSFVVNFAAGLEKCCLWMVLDGFEEGDFVWCVVSEGVFVDADAKLSWKGQEAARHDEVGDGEVGCDECDVRLKSYKTVLCLEWYGECVVKKCVVKLML